MRTCKELLLVRMPAHHRDLAFLTLETVQLIFMLAHIEYFDLITFASSEEPIPVYWIPTNLIDGIVVGRYCVGSFRPSSWIPDFDVMIFASSDYQRLGWMPVARPNIRSVLFENNLFFGSCKIKHFCLTIIWTGHKLERALRETNISDAVLVASELIFLWHLCIWIHDGSFFVSRY